MVIIVPDFEIKDLEFETPRNTIDFRQKKHPEFKVLQQKVWFESERAEVDRY